MTGPISTAIAGLGTMVAGAALSAIGFAAESTGGTDIAPWAQFGGYGALVGGLLVVLKKLLDGSLVPKPIDQLLQESAQRDQTNAAIAQELLGIVAEANRREDRLWTGRQP